MSNRRPWPGCSSPGTSLLLVAITSGGLTVGLTARAAAADQTALPPSAAPSTPADASSSPAAAASPASDAIGHSWDLPPLVVTGQALPALHEDERIGAYGQPRWVAVRRFAEVRAYVIPRGQLDFEYWLFIDTPSRHDLDQARAAGQPRPRPAITQQYEVEMGLGHRLQADIYQVYLKNGSNDVNQLDATKFEIRYALADWDRLWANPTLYGEWIQNAHGADNAEFKLLLADQLGPRWFWASNFVYQVETGNQREVSHEWNSGVSYTVRDQLLSIGAEDKIAYVTDRRDDGQGGFERARDHHWEALVGPSLRYYPVPQAHIDLTVFAGLTTRSTSSETVLIAGWEF